MYIDPILMQIVAQNPNKLMLTKGENNKTTTRREPSQASIVRLALRDISHLPTSS